MRMNSFQWARTNLTYLRTFDAVARHLSFSRAAAELGRSQATLSIQVRELELKLDTRLLDRTTRRVGLTEAGEALAQGLRDGFKTIGASISAARERSEGRRGRVVIACVPSLSGVRLPAILAEYRKRDTTTPIDVVELTYVQMIDSIAETAVDFGIGPCPDPPPANIAFTKAVDDSLCVLFSTDQAPVGLTAAPLSLLATLPLIFLRNSLPLQMNLRELAQAQGIRLISRTKVGHVQTAIGMVRAGAGAALVPRLALPDTMEDGLVALPIADTNPSLIRKVGVLTHRGRRLPVAAAKLARHVNTALVKSRFPRLGPSKG